MGMLTNPLCLEGELSCLVAAGGAKRVIGFGRENVDFLESKDRLLWTRDTEEPRGGIFVCSKPGVEGDDEDSSSDDDAINSSRISSSVPAPSHALDSVWGYTRNVLLEKWV